MKTNKNFVVRRQYFAFYMMFDRCALYFRCKLVLYISLLKSFWWPPKLYSTCSTKYNQPKWVKLLSIYTYKGRILVGYNFNSCDNRKWSWALLYALWILTLRDLCNVCNAISLCYRRIFLQFLVFMLPYGTWNYLLHVRANFDNNCFVVD